jgi:hypothetical protein
MGDHKVDLVCPECGAVVSVAAQLATVRTVIGDDPGTLKLRAVSAKIEHDCRQALLFEGAS